MGWCTRLQLHQARTCLTIGCRCTAPHESPTGCPDFTGMHRGPGPEKQLCLTIASVSRCGDVFINMQMMQILSIETVLIGEAEEVSWMASVRCRRTFGDFPKTLTQNLTSDVASPVAHFHGSRQDINILATIGCDMDPNAVQHPTLNRIWR